MTEDIVIDDVTIRECSSNQNAIRTIRKRFKRLSRVAAINLIRKILRRNLDINIEQLVGTKWKSFFQYNRGKFDENKKLTVDTITDLRTLLNGVLVEIGADIQHYDEDEHKTLNIKKINGNEFFVLDKNVSYKKVRNLVCDEGGEVSFKYDFKKPDLPITIPTSEETLQHSQIQILTDSVKFDYPVEYSYVCTQCRHRTIKKAYETVSTNTRINCQGIYDFVNPQTGEPKSKICGMGLHPDSEVSLTKTAYFYDIAYEDEEGNKQIANAISFEKYEPGFYDCVLFKIRNPKKTELYQLMDVKEMVSNKFKFPKKVDKENYLVTLQKAFDKYILDKTHMNIYGLLPIKYGIIIQTLFNILGLPLIGNLQVVGDAATGKSTVLKYYSFLLNGHLNLSTNGLSISIAGLRGTKANISLMGKEIKIVTHGYLGSYLSIHIDEAAEDPTLLQNLKTFLLESNYSYDKAGATGIFNKRTTHINISQNIDNAHLQIYRGMIKKAYNSENIEIEGETKEPWDESFDLHQPLSDYENPYLYKVVKDIRMNNKMKMKYWIDGADYALHQRFPFYWYLVNKKENIKLQSIVKENVSKNTIGENLELIKVMKTDDIKIFFNDLKKYLDCDKDIDAFSKVDKILIDYGIETDARMNTFYYNLVKISRILNQRKKYTEEDFDMLKYILETTQRKIDVVETTDFKVDGSPDTGLLEARDNKIEDSIKDTGDAFGLPEGEFTEF